MGSGRCSQASSLLHDESLCSDNGMAPWDVPQGLCLCKAML